MAFQRMDLGELEPSCCSSHLFPLAGSSLPLEKSLLVAGGL